MQSIPTEPASLPKTADALQRGIAAGLHLGAQVFVARDGQTIADFALGESRPGVAMTNDTLTLWLSACKPITAIGIAILLENQRLGIDDPVTDFIPEFGGGGKEAVTLRHLLTHTAGLRYVDTGWPAADWSQIIERICQTKLEPNWIPGQRARYDATTTWFVLGEVIRRLDGRAFERFVRDEIFEPLEMNDSWIGMPASRYREYGDRIGITFVTENPPIQPLHPYETELASINPRPAASGQGPIRELGRFYQMLLNGGELGGVHLLRPQTVALFTSVQRDGMLDETFRHKVDWGLGFLIDSKRHGYKTLPYSFGPYASEKSFGHNGFQTTMAFADPKNRLVVAIAPNGAPGEIPHDRRLREVLGSVYEDLGIVGC